MTVGFRVVGRIRKAFGLKGEVLVQAITNEPGAVFAPGSVVYCRRENRKASVEGPEFRPEARDESAGLTTCKVERSRPFKDGWLVKLEGVDDKTEADRWRGTELQADEVTLAPPDEGEVYLDELTGMLVRDDPHGELGVVAGYYQLPQGLVLEMRGEKWRADIPFNDAFVESIDRETRVVVVRLPDGLLELVPAPRH